MRNALKELLSSKKFIAMLVGMIVAVAGRYGLQLDSDTVTQIVGLFIAYIVGQGITDFGKPAAQIQSENPPPPEQVNIQAVNTEPPKD